MDLHFYIFIPENILMSPFPYQICPSPFDLNWRSVYKYTCIHHSRLTSFGILFQTDLVERFLEYLHKHMEQDPIWKGSYRCQSPPGGTYGDFWQTKWPLCLSLLRNRMLLVVEKSSPPYQKKTSQLSTLRSILLPLIMSKGKPVLP